MEFVGSSQSDYNEFAKQIQKVNKVIRGMRSEIPFKTLFPPNCKNNMLIGKILELREI